MDIDSHKLYIVLKIKMTFQEIQAMRTEKYYTFPSHPYQNRMNKLSKTTRQ